MKKELISSWKLVSNKGRELFIVTTESGATVWVPKNQFDTNAETLTYKILPVGTKYTKSDGTEGELLVARNEYTGCGKQIVKKYSSLELYRELSKEGITPSLVMN